MLLAQYARIPMISDITNALPNESASESASSTTYDDSMMAIDDADTIRATAVIGDGNTSAGARFVWNTTLEFATLALTTSGV